MKAVWLPSKKWWEDSGLLSLQKPLEMKRKRDAFYYI